MTRTSNWTTTGGRMAALLAAAFALWAAPEPARADPWMSVHPLAVSSAVRTVAGGWLLATIDADGDPVLATPATTAAIWASGTISAGGPDVRLGLGAPMGRDSRLTLRLEARRDEQDGVLGATSSRLTDLDRDGFSDLLSWRQRRGPVGELGDDSHIGARLGVRFPRWGAGLWVVHDRRQMLPGSALFAFPLTAMAISATGAADLVFDLETGDELTALLTSSELVRETTTLRYGLDLGVRFGAVGLALGGGLENEVVQDRAIANAESRFLGATQVLSADRDLERTEDRLVLAGRLDGRHLLSDRRVLLWTGGVRMRQPLATSWTGIEFLEERTDGIVGDVVTEWVRTPELLEATARSLEGRVAVGFADPGPELAYGVGLAWRARHEQRSETFRDSVRYRVDDPGVPGQRGRKFTEAQGYGDWEDSHERDRHEIALGLGGRYSLTRRFGLLLGGTVGYRTDVAGNDLRLIAVRDVSGTETIEPNVVNAVELPYANFDVVDARDQRVAETFQQVLAGFGFTVRHAELNAVFRWDGLDHQETLVEGIFRW